MSNPQQAFYKALYTANAVVPDSAPQLHVWFDGRWKWKTDCVLPALVVREIEDAIQRLNAHAP